MTINNLIDLNIECYLKGILHDIALCMGVNTSEKAVGYFEKIMDKMGMEVDIKIDEAQLILLPSSVNPVRLKNNPVQLDSDVLCHIHAELFG